MSPHNQADSDHREETPRFSGYVVSRLLQLNVMSFDHLLVHSRREFPFCPWVTRGAARSLENGKASKLLTKLFFIPGEDTMAHIQTSPVESQGHTQILMKVSFV